MRSAHHTKGGILQQCRQQILHLKPARLVYAKENERHVHFIPLNPAQEASPVPGGGRHFINTYCPTNNKIMATQKPPAGPAPSLAPCEYKTGRTLGQGSYATVKEAVQASFIRFRPLGLKGQSPEHAKSTQNTPKTFLIPHKNTPKYPNRLPSKENQTGFESSS